MAKVMGITAGRKNGNSEILLKQALMACEEAGAEVTMINLRDFHTQDCTGCTASDSLSGPCPARTDVPRYVRFVKEGKFSEALAVVHERLPFPECLGRVAPIPARVNAAVEMSAIRFPFATSSAMPPNTRTTSFGRRTANIFPPPESGYVWWAAARPV